jgi:hypothetical protein
VFLFFFFCSGGRGGGGMHVGNVLSIFQNLVIFVLLCSLTYNIFDTTGPNDPRFFPSIPFAAPPGGLGYVQFSFTSCAIAIFVF